MSTLFAKDPVWSQTTKSGFRHQVFVMYHSTKKENVKQWPNISYEMERNNPEFSILFFHKRKCQTFHVYWSK